MAQSRCSDEGTVSDDCSSGSEEGWGFLLGGLSTELMASTDWATNEDENLNKKDHEENGGAALRRSRPKNMIGKNRRELQLLTKRDQDNTNGTDNLNTNDDVQERLQQHTVSQRAFCTSKNGQILKPPVQILDRLSENKGNILIATKYIPKGSVIFTEKALEGIQIPSSSPTSGKGNLYTIRACQNCFKSLEPVSCISSKDLPLSELWPVPEYDGDPRSELQESVTVINSNQHSSMLFHAKSGRITCRDCGTTFCNRYCAEDHLQTIGDCCRCMRAIEELVLVVICSEKERLFPSNGDDGDEGDEGGNCSSFVDIDPVLILAARMFIAQVRQYRCIDSGRDFSDCSEYDYLFYGLCGEARDIRALGFESSSTLTNDVDNAGKILQPLQNEYEAIANAIELTESERNSDWRFSLWQFQKIVAIAQRNSISLMTGSPFRTYYQAMIRNTGGRGTSRQQQVASDVARLLGSKDGKLTRNMDRMIEDKCVVKMGGIFTLTAQMNHSCDPNAEIRSQEYVDCNIDIVAKEEIHEGEEICISYVNLGPNPSYSVVARNRRRRELSSRYLFNCQCSRCIE